MRQHWLAPLLVLALAGCNAEGRETERPQCPRASAPPGKDVVTEHPEGVTVAERGFSPGGSGRTVSMGAVIANSTDRVAYRTRVSLHPLDANGKPVLRTDTWLHFEIPVILPGEQAVVGAGGDVDSGRTERLDVEVDWTHLVALDPGNLLLRPLPIGVQNISRAGGAMTVDFGVENGPGCADDRVERGIAVLFRDIGGTVVGGGFDNTRVANRCAGSGDRQQAVVKVVPPTADLTKTRITAYCDVADPRGTASPEPVN
ncbi:hypothetical protein ACQP00_23280 [Dactylosporangium sp. CS-047395]|uniref:hypothetical protein n=1 Tax=Dactylosporangium sp. CS-047395 TaxID=3239936 RepID=UPI003D8BF90F